MQFTLRGAGAELVAAEAEAEAEALIANARTYDCTNEGRSVKVNRWCYERFKRYDELQYTM